MIFFYSCDSWERLAVKWRLGDDEGGGYDDDVIVICLVVVMFVADALMTIKGWVAIVVGLILSSERGSHHYF